MKNESGFTLIELLMVMVISGIVMAAIYSAYTSQTRAYQIQDEVSVVQQNLRAAAYYMEREIRMAGYDPFETVLSGFHNMSNQSVLELSWDGANGDTPDGVLLAAEFIRYKHQSSDNTLRRERGGGGYDNIAEYISGVTWTFLDQNGMETASDENVRSVLLTLDANYKSHSRQLTTQIFCRNLGL
ncbi:PilW family protein [Thermodesulfobacteriota bacterium]